MVFPIVVDYCALRHTARMCVVVSGGGIYTTRETSCDEYRQVAGDLFVELVAAHIGDSIVVYSAIPTIAGLVNAHPDLFGNVTVVSTVIDQLEDDFRLARAEVKRREREATSRFTCLSCSAGVVVATDASMQGGKHRAGIAAVSTTGAVMGRAVNARHIADAEFQAVNMALARWVGKTRELHILTDSREVYNALNAPQAGWERSQAALGSYRRCMNRLFSADAEGTDVYVHWVRGHDGNPLNEMADEVAVFTRRNDAWGLRDAQTMMMQRARVDAASLVAGKAMSDFVPGEGGDVLRSPSLVA